MQIFKDVNGIKVLNDFNDFNDKRGCAGSGAAPLRAEQADLQL